jgi:hypothetical protein
VVNGTDGTQNLYSPSGPLTVIVFLTVGLYDVAALEVFRSLKDSSTPGGIVIGVRPSFDGRFVVVENCRCANVCHAGTRNPGSATDEGARKAWPNALPLVGTNFEAIEICVAVAMDGNDVLREPWTMEFASELLGA